MRIDIVSLFPAMFTAVRNSGVCGRAIQRGSVNLKIWDPREFTEDVHRTVDDRPYGGGPGMVLKFAPLHGAIRAAIADAAQPVCVSYLSPQGRRLNQRRITELAQRERLLLVAGRYEGVDQRVLDALVEEEWSIGDYVLSGGELPAMVLIDAVVRLQSGTLGHGDSANNDSFAHGMLDWPHYTRPEWVEGRGVPAVLLSGDHQAVARWRLKQALGYTWLKRPDLLQQLELSAAEESLLQSFKTDYKDDLESK